MTSCALDTPASPSRAARWPARLAAAAGLLGLWLLCRPYPGVQYDAVLYVGRALADLDPAGLGADIAFAHDGQSGFSVFPPLLAWLVGALGPGPAAMATAAAGLALWLGAAGYLFSRLLRGRAVWAALVCVAAFPAAYGGFAMFEWGEAIATPRVFAEAFGLAALGALTDGRRLLALALAALAAAFHPIMALPVLGVGLGVLGLQDRRWFLLAAFGAALGLAAAVAGVPLAGRLLVPFDATWARIVADRSPQVLPWLWPASSWGLPLCQAATLLLAARLAPPPARRTFAAALAVAALGTLAAAVVPTVLVTQLQPWRAQWIAAVLAAGAFPFAGHRLWARGANGRIALALLAAAWIARDNAVAAGVAAAFAVFLGRGALRREPPARAVVAAWALVGLFAVTAVALRTAVVVRGLAGLPAEYWLSAATWARTGLVSVLAGAAAVAGLSLPPRPRDLRLPSAAALLLLVAGLLLWDDRRAIDRTAEAGQGSGPLRALVASGSVYRLDSPGTNWLWTGRPEWWSQAQGAGVVFDRALAREWDRRLGVLMDAGLLAAADRRIYQERRAADPALTSGALARLCRAEGGPDWVMAPLPRTEPSLAAGASLRWRSPTTGYRPGPAGPVAERDHLIFDCRRF